MYGSMRTSSGDRRRRFDDDDPVAAVDYSGDRHGHGYSGDPYDDDVAGDPLNVVDIQDFDFDHMYPFATVGIIGPRGSGKSTAVRTIMNKFGRKFHLTVGFNPTEAANKTFRGVVLDSLIHTEFNPGPLRRLIEVQEGAVSETMRLRELEVDKLVKDGVSVDEAEEKARKIRLHKHLAILMDDCFGDVPTKEYIKTRGRDDPKFRDVLDSFAVGRNESLNKIFRNGRHLKVLLLIISQEPRAFGSTQRANFSYVFLYDMEYGERQKAWEDYGKMFPTYSEFSKALDECTKDRGCMVIDKTNQLERDLTKRVFRFRGDPKVTVKIHTQNIFRNMDKYYFDPSSVDNLKGIRNLVHKTLHPSRTYDLTSGHSKKKTLMEREFRLASSSSRDERRSSSRDKYGERRSGYDDRRSSSDDRRSSSDDRRRSGGGSGGGGGAVYVDLA